MLHNRKNAPDGVHVCTTRSRSGIADYAQDFQSLVLQRSGYELIDPNVILTESKEFPRDTVFHIQLGVFQHRERLAMSRLLATGYENVDVTIHDPPFLTFPYYQFQSPLLMRLSRGFDWYLGSLGMQRRALERVRRIFVLSEHGRSALQRLAPASNVVTIPHIIDERKIWPAGSSLGSALVYFGFIGPNKGVDYVLRLHQALMRLKPGVHLHILGQPSGKQGHRYLQDLKEQYQLNVTFHGYVPDNELDGIFEKAAHVILPYDTYKYIVPTSGSVIHALRRARIVWTTNANAMDEIIHDGENGFMLSMDVEKDAFRLFDVAGDSQLEGQISEGARQSALAMARYPYRDHFAESGGQPI